MAPPSWAFQVDNFDPAPDEELICSICRCVFSDPVQSPCNHVFCRVCIIKWLENNRNCPICRKRTTRFSLQEVLPLIKNMIMKLVLHCHNQDKGCEDKFTLEGCEGHVRECIYESMRCKNRPCKEMLLRKDLEEHEQNSCLHRYVKCKICSMKITSNASQRHNCILALKKQLKSKNELLKVKTKKIKELEQEIKSLKEAGLDDSSSLSSSESSSEMPTAAEVMIHLSSLSPARSDGSATSYYSTDGETEFDPYWIDTQEILHGLESNYRRMRGAVLSPESNNNHEDSVEHPRRASSSSLTPDASGPPARRPVKRRLPSMTVSSSDEEALCDLELPSLPSPKRNWRPPRREDATSTDPGASGEGVSPPQEGATASCSTALEGGPPTDHDLYRNPPAKLQLRSLPEIRVQSTPVQSSDNVMFRRTLSLLERSTLGSDPEWFPPNDSIVLDSDSDSDYQPPAEISVDVSSSSLSSDSSSETSFEVVRERSNLFSGLYNNGSSSSDDPDWLPQ